MKLPAVEIKERQQDRIVLDIALLPDLEAFQGHFPGYPVLPGVVQVDWAMRFGAAYFDLAEASARDIQIKFRKIISPGVPLTLILQFNRIKKRLSFTYNSDAVAMSSGHIKLDR